MGATTTSKSTNHRLPLYSSQFESSTYSPKSVTKSKFQQYPNKIKPKPLPTPQPTHKQPKPPRRSPSPKQHPSRPRPPSTHLLLQQPPHNQFRPRFQNHFNPG